jgi:HptB-dependent secretion and biofilm anti anti-sigma factor
MQIRETITNGVAILALEGRFDFNSHRDFRNAYDSLLNNAEAREIEINFEKVDYLDSSALGMLLLLREKVEASGKKIALSGLRGTVKQVLEIANFQRLFNIKN